MPGVYIHIPFCRQPCHYCNFHYSTSIKNKSDFISSLINEIEFQKDYLSSVSKKSKNDKHLIDTLYFGGGTPSILNIPEMVMLVEKLNEYFELVHDAEVTLEANPDDLTVEYLEALRKQTPVNRLSIGIQSFRDDDLKYLNRIHSSTQALQSIKNGYKAGFKNISADLIYGIPGLTNNKWKKNLLALVNLKVPHISTYCLTIEPKTALNVFIKRGDKEGVDDKQACEQFDIMADILPKYGYEHYEISNYGKPGYFSNHNISYWQNIPYLGLGPSAHSYNGTYRQWNTPNTSKYIEQIKQGNIPFEKEHISTEKAYNEYIMTSLRTQWGCNKNDINKIFGNMFLNHFIKESLPYLEKKLLVEKKDNITLTRKGKLLADKITSDLFI